MISYLKRGENLVEKVGIIAEYNPFHNGHLYHLNKVKNMFPNSYLILVLIGNFTQRADISIINKWDKTKIALEYGLDLVVELPYNIATSSASIYALGAIKILDELNCDYLVFGSETNDVEKFKEIAIKTSKNKIYQDKIKYFLDKGFNYPKSCSLALEHLFKDKIDKPNDVLALEYVRSIINLKSKIKPISIKRTNNYNDTNINDKITSASSIRKNISNKELIINTLPKKSYDLINNINYDDFFKYLKYEILTNDNLNDILDVDEGIENKLKKEIISVDKLEDLILKVKSKRYSYNRIKRMLLHILTKTKKDYDKEVKYIRVLGMNLNGMKILKEAKKNSNLQIVTKFKKEYYKLFEDDIKASKLYSLLTKYDVKKDFSKPIIKD